MQYPLSSLKVLAHWDAAVARDNESFRYHGFEAYHTAPRPTAAIVIDEYNLSQTQPENSRPDYLNRVFGHLGLSLANPQEGSTCHSQLLSSTGQCPYAETAFSLLYNHLNQTPHLPSSHKYVNIYHDNDNRPILLQKHRDAPTAISLVPFILNPIATPVPAGTLIALSGGRNERTGEKTLISSWGGPQTRMTASLYNPQTPMHPLRLSAYAFHYPLDRSIYAVDWTQRVDRARLKTVHELDLDDFNNFAKKLLVICQADGQRYLEAHEFVSMGREV